MDIQKGCFPERILIGKSYPGYMNTVSRSQKGNISNVSNRESTNYMVRQLKRNDRTIKNGTS